MCQFHCGFEGLCPGFVGVHTAFSCAAQKEELKRLKALKREELRKKIEKIQRISGMKGTPAHIYRTSTNAHTHGERERERRQTQAPEHKQNYRLFLLAEYISLIAVAEAPGLKEEDLEDEYDPERFDKQMAALFSDEYYNAEEEAEGKPQFSEDDEDLSFSVPEQVRAKETYNVWSHL
jgi:protein KRI1